MNFEEYFKSNETLVYNNKGVSMLPVIKQGRDFFVVKRKDKNTRCKKYDVAMYHDDAGRYVLHRIVKIGDNDYTFLGDNCITKEYNIREEQVIAVMTEFIRKGKKISVDNGFYRAYSRFWYFIYPVRKLFMVTRIKLIKLKKKLLGKDEKK